MQRHTTLYLYELAWMLPSVAIPVGMLAALVLRFRNNAQVAREVL